VWWFCRFVELTLRSPSLTAINLTSCPALSRIDITSSSLEVLSNCCSRMHIPDMYWVQNTINSVSGAAMSVVRTGIQWQPNISMGLPFFHHSYSFGVWSGQSNNFNFVRDLGQCSCIVAGFVLRFDSIDTLWWLLRMTLQFLVDAEIATEAAIGACQHGFAMSMASWGWSDWVRVVNRHSLQCLQWRWWLPKT
jgi:hypothetical protein